MLLSCLGVGSLVLPGEPVLPQQPQIFAPGIISTGEYESHPAFTASGDTLCFLKSAPDMSTWTLCFSYRRQGQWTTPVVAPFSGRYLDADPFFTRDGRTLYFMSYRPVQAGDSARRDTDIWRVHRTRTGWGAPEHLPAPVNSSEDEYYPTLTDQGALYFGSKRPGGQGGSDFYRCAPQGTGFGAAENLGPAINTAGHEYEPFIDPQERFLIFMAGRPADLRNADLYLAYRRRGQWQPARRLPMPFSSSSIEFSPKITRDGKAFFFASARSLPFVAPAQPETAAQLHHRLTSPGNGLGDIYWVDVKALGLDLMPAD
ncbi:PD40 domain-containing protein [Hymenobacter baengnokdamensis]|uniref:PD40 domain-containing protein n=1 Tax=Hymenobacter baengnokdamensis TaxID=2615203 RepID=UPI0017809C78|nr:PD40 domain-containing protein [Hymenobacter baengnokdamensis]